MNAYERYEKKIRKLACLLQTLKKNALYIAAGSLLMICVIVALLVVTGNITEDVVCDDITYGEELSYRAGVLWTDASFEFSAVGSDERTSELPTMPGKYVIYAYGENIFGERKYSRSEFTINKRPLTVKLSDTSVTYGDEISVDDVASVEGLTATDTLSPISLVYDRCLTGNNPITVDVDALSVTSADGKDITSAYDLRIISAYVTVNKRRIMISTSDFVKAYDASPLESDGNWKLEEGSFADGDTAEFRSDGSLTEVGEVPNKLVYTYIANAEGENVSDCYDIDVSEGTIKIVKGYVTLKVNDIIKTYTGKELTPENVTVEKGVLYDGDTLGSVLFSGSGTDAGEYTLGLRSFTIVNNGVDVTSDYIVDVVPGTLTILPIELKVKTSTQSFVYDGNKHSGTLSITEGKLAQGHKEDVYEMTTITRVGTVENKIVMAVMSDEGYVTKNYSITYEYGELTVTARPLKLEFKSVQMFYNGQTPSLVRPYNIMYGSLASGDTVVCSPKSEMIDVGTYDFEYNFSIISSSSEDITDCYAIDATFGKLYIMKTSVTFKTPTVYVTYNGQLQQVHEYVPFNDITANGHSWTNVNFTSSGKNVGEIPNEVEKNVRIVNADGRDVTHNFNISYNFGNLVIVQRKIYVNVDSIEKVYDGMPLFYNGAYSYSKQEDESHLEGLVIGHSITAELPQNVSRTDAGSTSIYATNIKILDEKGEDVTANYDVVSTYGQLTITSRSITITSASAIKYYDGTPLTDDGYTLEGEGLVYGEYLVFRVIGTITDPGSVPNLMSQIYVKKADGSDSTDNYAIYTAVGMLTVIDPDATEIGGSETGTAGTGESGQGQNDPTKLEPGFSLDVSGSLGIADNIPGSDGNPLEDKSAFSVYSTESHIAYLKYVSFGDYDGRMWERAPHFTPLLDGQFSYEYLTGIALSKANMRRINMHLKLNVSDYLLPYYLGTEGTDYTIQKSDSAHTGNCNAVYSVIYHYYDVETSGIPKVSLEEYANREYVYRVYVYKNYLSLPLMTERYYSQILKSNDFGDTTEEKIRNILKYVRSNAVYDLDYDRKLDQERDIATAFLSEYRKGVCQHFATAATAMFRAAGIPARYTVGWVTRTEANKWVAQKGAAHAWVEVYIDGIGWMHVDPTPMSDIDIEDLLSDRAEQTDIETLPKEPDSVIVPTDDEVVRFRTGYTGPMFLRESNYAQFINGRWSSKSEEKLNKYEELQLLFAALALESTGATEYKVKIDYVRVSEKLLLPYYMTNVITDKKLNGNISYAHDGSISSTYSFIPGIRCDTSFVGAELDERYAEIENMYRDLISNQYLDVSDKDRAMICEYFPSLLREKESMSKVNYVLDIVRKMRRKAIDDGITEAASLSECLEGGYLPSDEYATTLAILMLRLLEVNSRYVDGYLVSSVSSQTTIVRDSDRTCWMEIYVNGIGWIPVSVREDIPNPFADDDDITTQTLSLRMNSAEKLYDGEPLTANGFKIIGGRLLDGHTVSVRAYASRTYVGTTSYRFSEVTVHDEKGNDVSALYRINSLHSELKVYPLVANPIDHVKGMVGQTLSIGSYNWWTGNIGEDVVIKLVDDTDGVVLSENGDLTLKKPGIYRIAVSADGADYNGDGNREVEPIKRFEFSVIVNEFTNVLFMDMTLDEAVSRNHQQRPAVAEHFSPDGTHIGLVVEMNSGTKFYDGDALTADGVKVINGKLRSGDTVEAKGSGSIVFCGKAKNGCEELIIRDSEGRDVTHLYAVTVYPGTLTVSTAMPELPTNVLRIGLGETLFIGELFRSDEISAYPMSVSLGLDNGVVLFDGETIRGVMLGASVLNVTLYSCDLNGDGFYEYSRSRFTIRIETAIAAWQIVLMVLFAVVLVGYIAICIYERRSGKRKRGTE